MNTDPRFPRIALVCCCDGRWYPTSTEEMSRVGREHDDSPWSNHVVSSQLVMPDGAIEPLSWDRALAMLGAQHSPPTR